MLLISSFISKLLANIVLVYYIISGCVLVLHIEGEAIVELHMIQSLGCETFKNIDIKYRPQQMCNI